MSTQYTFWELLDDYSIEIPMIQRDYAQGRKDRKSEQIRKEFVRSLYESVSEVNVTQDLDFVYGTDKNEKLILLDGQQRLTTLFLLHWYLATRSGLLENHRIKLAKFSYQTRASSRDFCNSLISNSTDELFNNETKISSLIEDSSWFYSVWKSDPTVQSMLTMLDEIHRVFAKSESSEQLWLNLIDRVNPAITFHFLNLDEFGLTDELYVKMNARGKALSDFENFKAWLLGYVEKHDEIKVPTKFWLYLDKEWTDIFWQYTSNKKFTNFEVDKPFMRFFNLIVLFEWCIGLEVPNRKFDFSTEALISLFQRGQNVSIVQYLKVNAFNSQFFSRINTFLEFIRNDSNDAQRKVFFDVISSPRYVPLTKLYSQYAFIVQNEKWENVETKLIELEHWSRITKNLINNTIIDDPISFVRAVQSLDVLGNVEQDTVVKFAKYNSNNISFFNTKQRREEILKAELVKADQAWESLFKKAEGHEYFNGQIGFLLDLSLDEEKQEYSQSKFNDYHAKASVLFSSKLHEKNEFLLERALLSFHNYLISKSSNRGFCKYLLTDARARDENWRNIFSEPYFVQFLDAIHGDVELFLRSLIDNAEFSDWRQYFINYPQAIKVCGEKEVRFDYSGDIYLLTKKRLSGKYAELRSYILYCELTDQIKFGNFDSIDPKVSYQFIHGEMEKPSVHVRFKGCSYFISFGSLAYKVQEKTQDDVLVDVDKSVLPNELLELMLGIKCLGESNE